MRYCLHVKVLLGDKSNIYMLVKIHIHVQLVLEISMRNLTNNWKVSVIEENFHKNFSMLKVIIK